MCLKGELLPVWSGDDTKKIEFRFPMKSGERSFHIPRELPGEGERGVQRSSPLEGHAQVLGWGMAQ